MGKLPLSLAMVYRISKHTSTQATPSFLVNVSHGDGSFSSFGAREQALGLSGSYFMK